MRCADPPSIPGDARFRSSQENPLGLRRLALSQYMLSFRFGEPGYLLLPRLTDMYHTSSKST